LDGTCKVVNTIGGQHLGRDGIALATGKVIRKTWNQTLFEIGQNKCADCLGDAATADDYFFAGLWCYHRAEDQRCGV